LSKIVFSPSSSSVFVVYGVHRLQCDYLKVVFVRKSDNYGLVSTGWTDWTRGRKERAGNHGNVSFEGITAEEIDKGIWIKSLSMNKNHLRHIVFEPESLIPVHRYPEEVVTMIIEGEMEMTVGSETRRVKVGDVFMVPPATEHNCRTFDRHFMVSRAIRACQTLGFEGQPSIARPHG